MSNSVLTLWRFPRADFTAWANACCGGSPSVSDYDDYLSLLSATAAHAKTRGLDVEYREWSVRQMFRALDHAKLSNTPENRAKVLGDYRYGDGYRLSVRIDMRSRGPHQQPEGAIGWATMDIASPPHLIDSGEQLLGDDAKAAIQSRINHTTRRK